MEQNESIRILFILKKRHNYGDTHIGLSTGLYNSAMYIVDMLESNDIISKFVVVQDNNDIDREVTLFKPTHVIIEAIWVVPDKFVILTKLHPTVKWIIRLHSQLPFLSMEGVAMKWIWKYIELPNIIIAVNSSEMLSQIRFLSKIKMKWVNNEEHDRIIYLPNFYPMVSKVKKYCLEYEYIDVSCFGSIRPLKNHLIQAEAAIKFAEKIGKNLNFHINGNRVEQKGDAILQNLINLFDNLGDHKLILHDWLKQDDFLELCSKMDMGLQCSFSETFNIVGADMVSQGVPLVGSSEIVWIDQFSIANPTKSDDIYKKMLSAHRAPDINVKRNQCSLNKYSNNSKHIWLNYFNGDC